MGLARTPPPAKPTRGIQQQSTPIVAPQDPPSSPKIQSSRSSPKRQHQERNKTFSPGETENPFQQKSKLIRSPPDPKPSEPTPDQVHPEAQAELTIPTGPTTQATKPSSIPVPISQSRSPKVKSTAKTGSNQPSQPIPSATQLVHQQPNPRNSPQNEPHPGPTPSVSSPTTGQIASTNINQASSIAIARRGSHTTEDFSDPSTLTSAEPPSHQTPLSIHPIVNRSSVKSNLTKFPVLEHGPPHAQPISIEPLSLPAKTVPNHNRPGPIGCNGSSKDISKSVGPKDPLKLKHAAKVTNIANDIQFTSSTNHPFPIRLCTPPKHILTHDGDLSRESNQTTEFGFTQNIECLEHKIQELEQIIKLMENERLESELIRQAEDAQLIWDKELDSSKKLYGSSIHPELDSDGGQKMSDRFELDIKVLELKEMEKLVVIKELENRFLREKFDQVQSDYQARDQILLNELERLRMTNSEWAQIGHSFESLIEIERKEKEELENRLQAEIRNTKIEPNFEINDLKYQLLKAENRSELLEEQTAELSEKCKNLETQVSVEKNQKNKLARELEMAISSVKSLSDQILDLTSGLSEQQKGEVTKSQDILNARAALALKEAETANMKFTSSQSAAQQQRLESEKQPAPPRKGGKKKTGPTSATSQPAAAVVSSTSQIPTINEQSQASDRGQEVDRGNQMLVEEASEQNEPPGDDPLRQITSDHWTSIGVVAKKLNRTRKNNSSEPATIDPATKEIDAPTNRNPTIIAETNDQDQAQALQPKKKSVKSKNPSLDGPTTQLASSSNKENDIPNPKEVVNDLNPEEPSIPAIKKKAVKSRSKPLISDQIPATIDDIEDNDKAAPADQAGDGDEVRVNKKMNSSTQAVRKVRPTKSKNAETVIDDIGGEASKTDERHQVEKVVESEAGSKDQKGKQVEQPAVASLQPAETGGPVTQHETNLEGGAHTDDQGSKTLKRKKTKKTNNAEVEDDVNTSKEKDEDLNVSPEKVKKIKVKDKVKKVSKGKEKEKEKELDKEKETEEPEKDVEMDGEQEEEKRKKDKQKDKAKVKVKKQKVKKTEKQKVDDVNSKDGNDGGNNGEVDNQKGAEVEQDDNQERTAIEHKEPSNEQQDQDESIVSQAVATTKTKRKKKDAESKKSAKVLGKKAKEPESPGIENKDLDNKADKAEDEQDDEEGDSSFNTTKKKRKLFHSKGKGLNWNNDQDENNMLGLPPELSPVKKAPRSTLGGLKEKKKKSGIPILPPSFLL